MDKLVLKQGEAKPVTLTSTDAADLAVDLSEATSSLAVKKDKADEECIIFKEDADFDKSQAALGILMVRLTAVDTDQEEGTYVAELTNIWASPIPETYKTDDFYFVIKRAVKK